ncbi:hypothetical protein EHS25_000187 [Saitozyma podzolica]|uniref:Aminotransferase class V domain-containing protein n=1 Tax=Saitozyma podzolica TaxID=1890683 RepID=A0A427YVR5_9TREE|nr:hypothetical protein EHS25_000187 [Saitozyma podzolica]
MLTSEDEHCRNGSVAAAHNCLINIPGDRVAGYPDFGHNMLQYWKFRKNYLNFNHGSFGSTPIPVMRALREMSDLVEESPDTFMRRTYLPLLQSVRSRLAGMIGALPEELVIVPNVTVAINNIVSQIRWEDGDVIVCYSHTYPAISQTLKHICDRYPGVSLEIIKVTFPCAANDIIDKTAEILSTYNLPLQQQRNCITMAPQGRNLSQRVRLLVTDTISSTPGVICPWEPIVELCREFGVLSLVDGAHSIGQQAIDVQKARPDFFTSNCHKWLMSHRGSAFMYIPLRLVISATRLSGFPNANLLQKPAGAPFLPAYFSVLRIDPVSLNWITEQGVVLFETGTVDWTPLLTIDCALDFRQSIGGEKRIMEYCHELAVEGGKRLARRWDTKVMENKDFSSQGELTACMVNVAMPGVPHPADAEEERLQLRFFEDGFIMRNSFAQVPVVGSLVSAGVDRGEINDPPVSMKLMDRKVGDFDRMAEIVEDIIREISEGKHNPSRM